MYSNTIDMSRRSDSNGMSDFEPHNYSWTRLRFNFTYSSVFTTENNNKFKSPLHPNSVSVIRLKKSASVARPSIPNLKSSS